MLKKFLLIVFLCFALISCGQDDKNVSFFKNTEAYELAKSVEKNDTIEIKKILKENPKLLEIANPKSGSNVLSLAVILEKYEAFKTLMDLGANPNFINPINKKSVLIEACKFYWKPKPYSIDLRFMELLLQKGASSNYAIEKDFVDKNGNFQSATSAIHEASSLDLRIVKMLIKYGADPFKAINDKQKIPFKESYKSGHFEISNYYIDTLKVNPKDYVYDGEESDWSIQDYIITKFLMAKINNDSKEIEYLKNENPNIEQENMKRWEFIIKLEGLGVDFNNYHYKKKFNSRMR